MCRYNLNIDEKAIVDGHTGKLFRPSCWEHLLPYHAWMVGQKKSKKEAQEMLGLIFTGEKYISNMIAASQKMREVV